jgi:DNA-binding GntR family transcriptional regulator
MNVRAPPQKPYYEVVRDVLAENIRLGRLPQGLQLSASAVADRLGLSRPPIQRAFRLLQQEGIISFSATSGFVVGAPDETPPARLNLHQIDLVLPERLGANLVQASWERIFDAVEKDVHGCMPFGTFQISEAALGQHFQVSRTVIREVLSRMHGRGTISKDRSSHWIAGPLSARMLDEAHEVRRLLEPRALALAMPHFERPMLADMRERVRLALLSGQSVTQAEIDALEEDLHSTLIRQVRNRRLAEAVRHAQLSLVVNRLFDTYIGVHDEGDMLREHRLVLDHLMLSDAQGAPAALGYHLDADHRRARARLKVLSVFSEPEVAPYLVRVH